MWGGLRGGLVSSALQPVNAVTTELRTNHLEIDDIAKSPLVRHGFVADGTLSADVSTGKGSREGL